MKTGYFSVALGTVLLLSAAASAQFFSAQNEVGAAEEVQLAKPISLLDSVNDAQETAVEETAIESRDPEVSFYIQSLNLNEEQLATAQKISQENLTAKQDILQKIDALRQEARALEIGSLMAFEAILDDSQKASFHELRAGFAEARDAENDENGTEGGEE